MRTCWAKAWALYSKARSNGLLAKDCATSHVSAKLSGHSNNRGVSIQSENFAKQGTLFPLENFENIFF